MQKQFSVNRAASKKQLPINWLLNFGASLAIVVLTGCIITKQEPPLALDQQQRIFQDFVQGKYVSDEQLSKIDDALIRGLYSNDEAVQQIAAKVLSRHSGYMLGSYDYWVGGSTNNMQTAMLRGDAEWLQRQGEEAVAYLLKMLKIANIRDGKAAWIARKEAAEALDKIRWEPADVSEKVWYLYAKQDVDGLSAMGTEATGTMIEILRKHKGDTDYSLYQTMTKMRGYRYVFMSALVEALSYEKFPPAINVRESYGWTAMNDKEKVQYLLGKQDWDGLTAMAEAAVPALLASSQSFKPSLIVDTDRAKQAIINMGKTAVPAVKSALEDPATATRAAEILVEIDEPTAALVPVLSRALQGSDKRARGAAIEKAILVGPSAESLAPVLAKALKEDRDLREYADVILQSIRPSVTLKASALIELLHFGPSNRNATLLKAIENILSSIKPAFEDIWEEKEAVDDLAAVFYAHPDSAVRKVAEKSLMAMTGKTPPNAELVLKITDEERDRSQEWMTAPRSDALARIRKLVPDERQYLKTLILTFSYLAMPWSRRSVTMDIDRIYGEAATKELLQWLRSKSSHIRSGVVETLGHIYAPGNPWAGRERRASPSDYYTGVVKEELIRRLYDTEGALYQWKETVALNAAEALVSMNAYDDAVQVLSKDLEGLKKPEAEKALKLLKDRREALEKVRGGR